MNQQEIFTQNLNYYLKLSGKSQRQICIDLDIIPATFNLWVKGKNLPRIGTVQLLADYFGIEKTDLIDEHTNPTDDQKVRLLAYYSKLTDANKELLLNIAKTMTENSTK